MKPPVTLPRADATVAAAHLLEHYELRRQEWRRHVMASSRKAYEDSMRDLARIILLLHPELSPNIDRAHLPAEMSA